jgi:hypothetical protein
MTQPNYGSFNPHPLSQGQSELAGQGKYKVLSF